MPTRIQRRRTRGWRAPAGAVYVGRGTRWGNPWAVTLDRIRGWRVHPADDASVLSPAIVGWWESRQRAHEVAVARFREHATRTIGYAVEARVHLAGRDLMCWCPLPAPGEPDHCHAAVLLELANTTLED